MIAKACDTAAEFYCHSVAESLNSLYVTIHI